MNEIEGGLQGLRVLVTRPIHQQKSLCEQIRRAGGTPISFPLLTIKPVDDTELKQRNRSIIQDLDRYSHAIFISSNAATYGAELINDFWPQLPLGLEVFAMGSATAAVLRTELDCSVNCPDASVTSEELLSISELQFVRGKRIVIFRGKGGRELLGKTLLQRGAQVAYAEVYLREAVEFEFSELARILERKLKTLVVISSNESLQSLWQQAQQIVNTLPLVVPSRRVADTARHLGFQQVVTADGANDMAIIAALVRAADNLQ